MRVLAVDQGTTSTRGIVFSGEASPETVASLRHAQHLPADGWVEQDPLEILAHVRACIAAAGRIDAIGLANQGESCLAWDGKTGAPLSPLLTWQDARTEDEVARLRAAGHEGRVRARTGLPLDSYFAATKLAWLLRELPAVRAANAAGRLRLGTSDAFLLQHLTGRCATDPSTASRTALMALDRLAWDDELCALFGVPIEALPPIVPTTGPFGYWEGVPVRASLVDQPAALHGHGPVRPGAVKITFGTGAFALLDAGETAPEAGEDGLIVTVAASEGGGVRYALEGGVYDAGAAIEWLERIGLCGDAAALMPEGGPPAIERGLVFVPALSGLACPTWRRDARALWLGIAANTTAADLGRAVGEGIAMQANMVLETMATRVPLGPAISVDGGLAQNNGFLQFLADASGRTIRRPAWTELTAFGCALLAGHCGPQPGGQAATFQPRVDAAIRRRWQACYRAAVTRALP